MSAPRASLVAAALALLPALAITGSPTRHVIRPIGECLDPTQVQGFHAVGHATLLIDAGRRHYRVDLGQQCESLDTATGVKLIGSGTGRLCGNIGEAVVVGRQRCIVSGVTILTPAEYEAASSREISRPANSATAADH